MDKMREEFESWAKNHNYDLSVIPDGTYYVGITFHAWEAWQASRSALVVELPSHVNDMDSAPMLYDSIVEQLDELGIRYDKY